MLEYAKPPISGGFCGLPRRRVVIIIIYYNFFLNNNCCNVVDGDCVSSDGLHEIVGPALGHTRWPSGKGALSAR